MEDFLVAVDSSAALFALQVRIASELRASEKADCDDERWHRRRLRNIGDAIVWRVLTPHAIRSLSVHGRRPPALSGQGAAFDHVISAGRSLAESGATVILSDITNRVGIGDLVACGDPDAPTIVECKLSVRSARRQMQGRRGRQVSRARAVGVYLRQGRGKFPGIPGEKIAVEVPATSEHCWGSVMAVVRDSLSRGIGVVRTDREAIWAVQPDSPAPIPQEVVAQFRERRVLVGCHSRLLDDDPPLVPHPLVWPIEREVAFALTEMDVWLCHAVEESLFAGHATERARLCGLVELAPEVVGVAAEIDGVAAQLGPRFVANVLYGFETVGSAASYMLGGLERSVEIERKLPAEAPPPCPKLDRKPSAYVIETQADAEGFLAAVSAGEISDTDIVMFGPDFARDSVPLSPGAVLLVGPPSEPMDQELTAKVTLLKATSIRYLDDGNAFARFAATTRSCELFVKIPLLEAVAGHESAWQEWLALTLARAVGLPALEPHPVEVDSQSLAAADRARTFWGYGTVFTGTPYLHQPRPAGYAALDDASRALLYVFDNFLSYMDRGRPGHREDCLLDDAGRPVIVDWSVCGFPQRGNASSDPSVYTWDASKFLAPSLTGGTISSACDKVGALADATINAVVAAAASTWQRMDEAAVHTWLTLRRNAIREAFAREPNPPW